MECLDMRSLLISAVQGVNMANGRQNVVAEKEVALCFSKLGSTSARTEIQGHFRVMLSWEL